MQISGVYGRSEKGSARANTNVGRRDKKHGRRRLSRSNSSSNESSSVLSDVDVGSFDESQFDLLDQLDQKL